MFSTQLDYLDLVRCAMLFFMWFTLVEKIARRISRLINILEQQNMNAVDTCACTWNGLLCTQQYKLHEQCTLIHDTCRSHACTDYYWARSMSSYRLAASLSFVLQMSTVLQWMQFCRLHRSRLCHTQETYTGMQKEKVNLWKRHCKKSYKWRLKSQKRKKGCTCWEVCKYPFKPRCKEASPYCVAQNHNCEAIRTWGQELPLQPRYFYSDLFTF